jgi:DNA-binding SARP family transcriptional activator/tetratricopeptide (TPR) repeat protein/KaiC/GvpD/RAD55 family RecA-like ATPase
VRENRLPEPQSGSPAGRTPARVLEPLALKLFGGLRVEVDGEDVAQRLPGRQGRTLVAYLVLNRDRPVSRDELLDVLWPSQPPVAPEAALNSVLAKVRRAIGPELITGRQAVVLELPANAYVDVHAVGEQTERAERALADGDPATALDAAQSVVDVIGLPLLPSLDGDWLEPWRRHFAELVPRAQEIAVRAGLMLGDGHLPAAERAAAALVADEPFREAGYALLMEAQARQGNVAEALRTFEQVRVLLRDELGTSPSQSLVALHDSLLRSDHPTVPMAAVAPPVQPSGHVLSTVTSQMIDGAFVGREEFSQRLRQRWEETRGGQTRLVLLVGEAGVGKTRLAAEFAEEVHRGGGTVLYGRADEEALLPHQPFVEALRQLVNRGDATLAVAAERDREILWRLLPDLAPPSHALEAIGHGDDDTLRYRLFEAVAELLCATSARSPLLLILDDLHWADKSTLLLLRHLLRHPRLTRLLVVGTFRHVEVGRDHPLVDLLTDLRRERRYDRLTLVGLDDAATQTLVADRLQRDVTPAFVRRLREQTEGNVFFIEETIRALLDSGLADDEPVTEAALERLGVPEGVSEIVGRRVSNLSPLAAEALTAASVIGRDFRLGIVAQILGESPEQVMCALEESMAAGLVLEVADRIDVFTFSHALVREVLYGQLSASRRVRLHHCAAEALEAVAEREQVNPAELAHHFLLARHFTGAGPARRYTIAAGARAIEMLAYEEAVQHYGQAVTLFDDDDEQRCEVLLALGRAQWRAGSDARHTFRTAADSAARRGDANQLARAALGHSARYHESELVGTHSRELLEEALAALGSADTVRRALLLSRLAGNLAFAADQRERASAVSAEAVAVARRIGDENVLLAALMARHTALLHVRRHDERLALSEEFMALRVSRRELLAERHQWRLYDLLEAADIEAALEEQPRLEALAKHMRQPQWHSIAVGWRGVWAELAGDVELAERCAEECLQHGQRADMKDALSTWTGKLLMMRRRQGRLHELTDAVQRLVRGAGLSEIGWRSTLGLIHAECGDEDAARAIYREELASYSSALPQFWLTNLAVLSELCVALDDADGARELYTALAPYARLNVVVGFSSCWGPVERYLALLAATYGDQQRRAMHARSALARARAMNAPLFIAELERRHGALLAA